MNLHDASVQWAIRPMDERFWSLEDLRTHLVAEKMKTNEGQASNKDIEVRVVEGAKPHGVVLHNRLKGAEATCALTHWSFNQLCSKVGAPADFLRSLPAEHVSSDLNYLLQRREDDLNKTLVTKVNGFWNLRSITSDSYGRVWDLDVVNTLTPALDKGWKVPPARPAHTDDPRARPATKADILPNQDDFGLAVKEGEMIAPATPCRGDRDSFILLVNPERIIDDGSKGLMRGLIVTNSEVRNGSLQVKSFLMENVCGNLILWGVSKVTNFRTIHRGEKTLDRFQTGLRSLLLDYDQQSSDVEWGMVQQARKHVLVEKYDEDGVKKIQAMDTGLSMTDIRIGFEFGTKFEHTALAPPGTTWNFVHGLTRASQIGNGDSFMGERVRLDRAAGKLLERVSPVKV